MISTDQLASQIIDKIESIWIEETSWDSDVAIRIRKLSDPSKIFKIADGLMESKNELSSAEYEKSKKQLLLTRFKGKFFKRCPGSSQKKILACCNYHILNLGQQCPMDCSYCYLQSYLKTKALQIYTNIDDAILEMKEMSETLADQNFRVGTGEIIDSLALDPVTLYSKKLIPFFNENPRWTLEFKTKSDHVTQFLDEKHHGNVIASWSLNPDFIIQKEEHLTASLENRLLAAKKCLDKNFQISFHLDPLIYFDNWQFHYIELIKKITTIFKPQDLQIISLGALRFQPEQKTIMRQRFGMSSLVTRSEMLPSEGGKLRYHQTIRNEMYAFVKDAFKKVNPKYNVYLCMETPETWIQSLGHMPSQDVNLQSIFKPIKNLEVSGTNPL